MDVMVNFNCTSTVDNMGFFLEGEGVSGQQGKRKADKGNSRSLNWLFKVNLPEPQQGVYCLVLVQVFKSRRACHKFCVNVNFIIRTEPALFQTQWQTGLKPAPNPLSA